MLGRGKRQAAPRRRESRVRQEWWLLDWKGKEEVLEVQDDAINRRTGLFVHDLCKFLFYPSIILSHERAIAFNWEHVKVVITPQAVLIPNIGDSFVTLFVHKLQAWILHIYQGSSSSDPDHNVINILSPFEFIILEYCLKTVSSELDDQVKTFEQETHSVLDQIISKIWIVSNAKTEVINEIKVQLGNLTTCVQKVRDQLEQLNRDDKRKAEMCLTKKFDQQISSANRTVPDFDAGGLSDKDNKPLDVKELETLLNTYLMQNNETLKKLSTLRRYVDKEEWIIWKKAHQIFKLKLGLLGFIGVVGWGWSLFLYWK